MSDDFETVREALDVLDGANRRAAFGAYSRLESRLREAEDLYADASGEADDERKMREAAEAERARLREELVALRPLVRRFGSQYENDDYDKTLGGTSDE